MKAAALVEQCEVQYELKIVYSEEVSLHTLKRLRRKLYKVQPEEKIVFVHGIGKRKSPLQKSIEELEYDIEKIREYTHKLYLCGKRNSCKTPLEERRKVLKQEKRCAAPLIKNQ